MRAKLERGVACITTSLLLTSCSMFGGNSADDALKALQWSYAANAITLQLDASADLNQHDGAPHTVSLAVVQTADASTFAQLTDSPEALAQLLSNDSTPDQALDVQRLFVAPSAQSQIKLARAAGARFVGVVAGFYQLDPKNSTRSYAIATVVHSTGWLAKHRTAEPAPLTIALHLGRAAILNLPVPVTAASGTPTAGSS
ncbi:MAG: type VI secretion system lipoprotein TssJ [Janthinobacterium lividum]